MNERKTFLPVDKEGKSSKPRRLYGPGNAMLDPLENAIQKLNAERERVGHRQDAAYKLDTKTAILSIAEQLDKAAPLALTQSAASQDIPGIEPDQRQPTTIGSRLQELNKLQRDCRFEEDPAKQKTLRHESAAKVQELRRFISDQREKIQPKRPRLKHNNMRTPFVFSQVKSAYYSPFVRELAAASAQEYREQKSASNPNPFGNLPHLNQVAKEAQAFVAMLDFSEEVEAILKQSHARAYSKELFPASRQYGKYRAHQDPEELYWEQNREELSEELQHAADKFNKAIAPLRLKVGSASEAYLACIAAEKHILRSRTYAGVTAAHENLKHHAFLFVMGGHDNVADIHYNKLLTRIGAAYAADKLEVEKQSRAYEYTHDIDYCPFSNPLDAASQTLKKVYEARWALAADAVEDMVVDYRKAIANPKIADPNDFPPSNVISEVHRKEKPPRQPLPRRKDMSAREERQRRMELVDQEGLPESFVDRVIMHEQDERAWRPQGRSK